MTSSPEAAADPRKSRGLVVAAFVVAAVAFFSGLGSIPLMQPDEGRNAEVAREMAASGSWLVPTLEGHPYLDKPAAYFAAVRISLRAFGNTEWGARLPSALCALGIAIVVFAFARRHYDPETAALAVIVVATSPMVIAFAHIVIMDMALALCTTAAILSSFTAEAGSSPDRRWHAVGAAAAGVGTLIKGPVGFLVPAAVMVAFFAIDRRPKALLRVFAPWNCAIVLALVLPWFIGLTRAHPEFLHYGLVEESFNRFFKSTFNRGQPFWFFAPVFVETLMPWTILFVPMAWVAWRVRGRWTAADRLFVAWTIVVLLFFSLSRTKQPGYILPGIVAAAVLVGRGLGHAWRRPDGAAARVVFRGAVVLAAFAVAGAAFAARGSGWVEAIGARLIAVLVVTAALAVAAFVRRRTGWAIVAFALIPLSVVTVLLPGAAAYARGRSAKPLAEALATLPPGTEIAGLGCYPAGLSFYRGRTMTIVDDGATPLRSNFIDYWLRRQAVRPATLVARDGRDLWLAARTGDTLVLASEGTRADLVAWLGDRAEIREVAPAWWGALVPRPAGR